MKNKKTEFIDEGVGRGAKLHKVKNSEATNAYVPLINMALAKGYKLKQVANLIDFTYTSLWAVYHGYRDSMNLVYLENLCELVGKTKEEARDIYVKQKAKNDALRVERRIETMKNKG